MMGAMIDAFRAGGWGSWVVLLLGGAALVNAVLFLRKAEPRRLAIIRGLSAATVFSAITGMSSGFIAVTGYIQDHPELRPTGDAPYAVLQGLGEIANVPALAGMLLALTWLFVAVGTRRLADET